MPPSDAQRRANAKQDAARSKKRAAVWIDAKTLKALDKLRGKTPRAAYVREMIEERAK
jgi:hypothetical protein